MRRYGSTAAIRCRSARLAALCHRSGKHVSSVGMFRVRGRLEETHELGESERAKGQLGQVVSLGGAAPLGILPTFPRCFLRAQGYPEDIFVDSVFFPKFVHERLRFLFGDFSLIA